MYWPYHEMDISQFTDELDRLYRNARSESNLKRLRTQANLSQSELANFATISVRTIQELEQGRKDINKARSTPSSRLPRHFMSQSSPSSNGFPSPKPSQTTC